MTPGRYQELSGSLRNQTGALWLGVISGTAIFASVFALAKVFQPKALMFVAVVGWLMMNISWGLFLIQRWFSPPGFVAQKFIAILPGFKPALDWGKSVFLTMWFLGGIGGAIIMLRHIVTGH